jgi:hypothetical protein
MVPSRRDGGRGAAEADDEVARMMVMSRRVAIGALAVTLLGCKAMKLRPYKEQGEAKLAALEAIRAKVASMPPLAADAVKPVSLRTSSYGSGKRNAVWMHLEEMQYLSAYQSVPLRLLKGEDFHWTEAVSMLQNGPGSNTTDFEIQSAFERFLAIEHVVVIKITSLAKPKLTGQNKFEGGSASGEVHVFTLAGAVHHGGVRFSAKNRPKVSVDLMKSDEGLLEDLGSEALSAASQALRKQLPDYN